MANVTTAAPAEGDDGKKKPRRFSRSPVSGYVPTGGNLWGVGTAILDGKPWFTWLDIPRMMRDPNVIFISYLWRAPFQKQRFKVEADSKPLASFVEKTVARFWRKSVPALLARYFAHGYAAGGAEFLARRGYYRLERVRAVECRDAAPHAYKSGERRGRFAGFELRSKNEDAAGFVGSPHAMWFAGLHRLGQFYDQPPISGMFVPWLEKNRRNGALDSRGLWYSKNAADGGVLRYPDGESKIGPDEASATRNNQDIAREILDAHETNGTLGLSNAPNPAMEGEYDWEWTPPVSRTDLAGFLEYPDKLDLEMLKGAGIPQEVVASSPSGSGYNGRLLPYQGFLGIVDELSGLLVDACESWLRPLAEQNFGPHCWYEVEPVSLAQQVEDEQKQLQKRSGELPAKPGMGGDLPFTLSTLDRGLRRGGWRVTESGNYVRVEGRRRVRQLSTLTVPPKPADPVLEALNRLSAEVAALKAPPAQPTTVVEVAAPAPAPPPEWPEYECPKCGGIAFPGDPSSGIRYRGSAKCTDCGSTFSCVGMRPRAMELAATATPEDDPEAKARAFDATAKKLTRQRKSTVVQLLALAMVRAQQRANAEGRPEAAAGSLSQLSEMAGDPVQVAKIVGMKGSGGAEMSATELSALELAWVGPKVGPRRGRYYLNTETNKKVYTDKKPGEGRERREGAEKAARELVKKIAGRKATAEDVKALASHLPHVRNEELLKYRAHLEFNLKGERKKQFMVERLLDHVEKKVTGGVEKPRAPEHSRNPTKSKLAGTVASAVRRFGGIDPNDHDFLTHYGSVKEAIDDGIPRAAFKAGGGGKGRRGLDQLAQELHRAGLVNVPEHENPSEYLLGLMKSGAKESGDEGLSDRELNQRLFDLYGPGGEGDGGYAPDPAVEAELRGEAAPAGEGDDVFPGLGAIGGEPPKEAGPAAEPEAEVAPEPAKEPAPPPEVAAEVAKEVARPAEKPKGKRPKNAPVVVDASRKKEIGATMAYNSVLKSAQAQDDPEKLQRLVDAAAALGRELPESQRDKYLKKIAAAAQGRGQLLELPTVGEPEPAEPEPEVAPEEAAANEKFLKGLLGGETGKETVGADDLERMGRLLRRDPDEDDEGEEEEPDGGAPARDFDAEIRGATAAEMRAKQAYLRNPKPANKKAYEDAVAATKNLQKEQKSGKRPAAAPVSGVLKDEAAVLARRRAKAPEPARSEPAPAPPEAANKDRPKREPKKPPGQQKPKGKPAGSGAAAVRRMAEAEADPAAKDWLESALHNARPNDPMDLARTLGSSVEESGSGPGGHAARPIPPAAVDAARRALAALGAAPEESGEYSARLHQPAPGLFPGDPVETVRPALVLNGEVVARGVVRPKAK